MGSLFDDDDFLLFALLADLKSPISILVSLTFLGVLLFFIYQAVNYCNNNCLPNDSRLIDHECYCIQEDGSLKALK